MLLLVLFALGAHVGSFLNVCIWRLPRGESVVEPPSHCPRCNTRLRLLDLVPLASQVALRGRCRYCGAPISWRYFGIEFLTGVLFVLVGAQPGNLDGGWWSGVWVGDPIRLLQELVIVSALVVIFWIDYETFLIPISAALLIGLAGVGHDLWEVAYGGKAMTEAAVFGVPLLPAPLPESLLAMVAAATFLWIVRAAFTWIYGQEAMGFGDVFLVASIAANIGWKATIFSFFFLSVCLGALIGSALQIPRAVRAYRWARARAMRVQAASGPHGTAKEETPPRRSLAWPLARHAFRKSIPFGPMLAVGAIVTILHGARLNDAYLTWVNSMAEPAAALNKPIPFR
jgi:leader peptidase (prepilin peptidase) / N-methyltransferase